MTMETKTQGLEIFFKGLCNDYATWAYDAKSNPKDFSRYPEIILRNCENQTTCIKFRERYSSNIINANKILVYPDQEEALKNCLQSPQCERIFNSLKELNLKLCKD